MRFRFLLLISPYFAPVHDRMFVDAFEPALLGRTKRFERAVIVRVNRFDPTTVGQTLGDMPIKREVNSIHAENPSLSAGERTQTQLQGEEPRRLAPRQRLDERFHLVGE